MVPSNQRSLQISINVLSKGLSLQFCIVGCNFIDADMRHAAICCIDFPLFFSLLSFATVSASAGSNKVKTPIFNFW